MQKVFWIISGAALLLLIYVAAVKAIWTEDGIAPTTVVGLIVINIFCLGILAIIEAIKQKN
jgi:uncharacterized membrane protein